MVGVHYRTAYDWWCKGKLPVPAYQAPSGSIMVDVPMPADSGGRCVVYARVSSRDQADGLDDSETDDDLVRDVTEVLTSLCMRLCGKRSVRARAARGVAAARAGGGDG